MTVEQRARGVDAAAVADDHDEESASWVDPYWLIVSSAPVPLVELDEEGRIRRSNPAFVQLVGGRRSGRGAVRDLRPLLGAEKWKEILLRVEAEGTVRNLQTMLERPDGISVPVEIMATAVRLPSSETRIIGSLRDISNQRAAEERLRQEAMRDALTGLPHRGALVEDLEHRILRLRRSPDRAFAVGFLDLDDFKTVNDTAGHIVGDQVLIAISDRMKNGLRPDDRAYRYGGDEFVILFADVPDPEAAGAVGRRLLELVSQPLRIGDKLMKVGASLGLCLCDNPVADPQTLITRADDAMVSVKQSGTGGQARIVAC